MSTPILLFFRRYGVELYDGQSDTPQVFPFAPESVQHLEVLDEPAYVAQVNAFVQQAIPPKAAVVIGISEDVLFHAAFVDQENQPKKEQEKQYLEAVPIDPHFRHHKDWVVGEQLHCYAVNAQLYQPFIDAVRKLKGQLLGVYPLSVFGELENLQAVFGQQPGLLAGSAQVVLSSYQKFKPVDLYVEPVLSFAVKTKPSSLPKVEMPEKKKMALQLFAFLIFFITVIGCVGYVMKKQADDNMALSKKRAAALQATQQDEVKGSTASPIVQPAPTIAATTSAATSTDYSVQIINGSGVAGQGAKVKALLSPLHLQSFDVSNGSPADPAHTVVVFSGRVPLSLRTQVAKQLISSFPSLIQKETSDQVKFDIVVTTAK